MIVGTAELDVVARTANFDRDLRAKIEGGGAGLAAVGTEAEAAGAKVTRTGEDVERAGRRMESEGGRLEKVFAHAGNTLGAWGLPFGEALKGAGEKVSGFSAQGTSAWAKFSTAANAGAVAAVVAGAAVAAEGIHLAVEYQKAGASLQAHAGISQQAAHNIGAAFLDQAGKTTFSAQETLTAYSAVAGQLGLTEGHALSAADALKVMTGAQDLAEASGTDLNTTTAALSNVMQAYQLSVGQAGEASNTLFNVSRSLNIPVGQVSEAMAKLKGRLGDAAPDMNATGALMLELGEHGIRGSRGIMLVNTSLSTLLGGTKPVTNELGKLGVHVYDAQGKFVGMGSVISQLQPKLAGMSDQQRDLAEKTLFGSSAGRAMNSILLGGAAAYDKATAAVTKHGAVESAARAQSQTFEGQLKMLRSTFLDLATKVGAVLIPIIVDVGKAFAGVTSFLMDHKAILIALAAVVGVVLGGAIIDFAINKATKFGRAVKGMVEGLLGFGETEKAVAVTSEESGVAIEAGLGPIGLILAAVGIAVVLLATHWKQVWGAIKAVAEDAWKGIRAVVSAAWDGFLKPTFDAIRSAVMAVAGVFISAWHGIDAVFQFVAGHIVTIAKVIIAVALGPIDIAIDLLWTHWHTVWGAVVSVLNAAWNGIIHPVLNMIRTAGLDVLRAGLTVFHFVWSVTWGLISDAVRGAWAIVSPILGVVKTAGLDVIQGAITTLKTVWDAAWGGFHAAVEAMWKIVKPILETIKKILDGIGKVAGVVGKGLGALGGLAKGAGGLAGKALGFIGLAEGGIVTRPTLAMIAEKGHPEAVLPLGDPARIAEILTQVASQAPGQGAATMAGTMTNTSGLYGAGMTRASQPATSSTASAGGGDTIVIGPVVAPSPENAAQETVRKLRGRQWLQGR